MYYLGKILSTYDFFYLTKSSFTTFDLMNLSLKKILPLAGAFIAYRLYKLYELGNSVQWSVASVDFIRPIYVKDSLNQFIVRVKFRINNPTNTKVHLRMVTGEMKYANVKIGTFKMGAFDLKGGEQFVDGDFVIDNKVVVASLVDAIAARKYPVINVTLKKYLPLFSTTEVFDVNMKDYVPTNKFNIFK